MRPADFYAWPAQPERRHVRHLQSFVYGRCESRERFLDVLTHHPWTQRKYGECSNRTDRHSKAGHMKILQSQFKSLRGNTLVLTIVVTGLVGFLLASYMGLVKSQNISTMRSQSWNAAIPVIEAGIEDALTHINIKLTNDLVGEGWSKQGSIYVTKRHVGSNYYSVTISNWVVGSPTNQPIIEARGYVSAPVTLASIDGPMFATVGVTANARKYVARGIRCITRSDALFSKGLVAKGQIDMRGNDISADSYDSLDPDHNTGGRYDATKRKAGGSI